MLDAEEERDFATMDSMARNPEAAPVADFNQRMHQVDLTKLMRANGNDMDQMRAAYRKIKAVEGLKQKEVLLKEQAKKRKEFENMQKNAVESAKNAVKRMEKRGGERKKLEQEGSAASAAVEGCQVEAAKVQAQQLALMTQLDEDQQSKSAQLEMAKMEADPELFQVPTNPTDPIYLTDLTNPTTLLTLLTLLCNKN
jgi:hypothetical protein